MCQCGARSGLPQSLLYVCWSGVRALKRPNEAETVAYRLTVCNSLLSTYSLNGVCVCNLASQGVTNEYSLAKAYTFISVSSGKHAITHTLLVHVYILLYDILYQFCPILARFSQQCGGHQGSWLCMVIWAVSTIKSS